MPGPRTRSRGFTFIEAAVVVAVLGIVAAMAAPSFRDYLRRSNLRGAVNEAYTDLMFARSDAVQQSSVGTALTAASRRVTFTSTGYVVSNDLAVGATGYTAYKTVTMPSGVTIAPSGTPFYVVFEPVRGTATTTPSGGTLTFSAAGVSGTARITVNALGRVALCSSSTVPLGGIVAC